jgi:hypothetical protein
MYFLQTLDINLSYVFSSYSMSYVYIGHVYMKSLKRIHKTCLYEEFEENTQDMYIWRVWREYIGHVYMKRIHRTCYMKRIHRTSYIKSLTCPMYSLQTLHINMSYEFSSNSSYKHVLCILFKLFIKTCPMYALQTLHINISYVFSSRTCLYYEFEENT